MLDMNLKAVSVNRYVIEEDQYKFSQIKSNVLFIKAWNVVGVLVRSKSITLNS